LAWLRLAVVVVVLLLLVAKQLAAGKAESDYPHKEHLTLLAIR
jgi:hypothetical protein